MSQYGISTPLSLTSSHMDNPVLSLESQPSHHLDPRPLMVRHPPRITDSNTRIPLMEGSPGEPWPKDVNGLGWVQIHQKSLQWEEIIDGSSIVTHEGLTTLTHPKIGWTITSGTWNTFQTTWGKNPDTVDRIHESWSSRSTCLLPFGIEECYGVNRQKMRDCVIFVLSFWWGTESGLLGTFDFCNFISTCTSGDGSCDTSSDINKNVPHGSDGKYGNCPSFQ